MKLCPRLLTFPAGLVTAAALYCGHAVAQDLLPAVDAKVAQHPELMRNVVAAVSNSDVLSVFSAGVASDRLASQRGGTDIVTTQAKLSGVVSDNAATNVTTGSNTIDAGSFANATGMPVVIQNTGANVLIQNATVINLQLK